MMGCTTRQLIYGSMWIRMKYPDFRLKFDLSYKNRYDAIAWYYKGQQLISAQAITMGDYEGAPIIEVGGLLTLEDAKQCVANMQKQIDIYEESLDVDRG